MPDSSRVFAERVDAATKCTLVAVAAVLAALMKGPVPLGVLWASSLVWALTLARPLLLVKAHAVVLALWGVACLFVLGIGIGDKAGVGPVGLGIPFVRGLCILNTVLVLALSSKVEDLMAVLERLRLPFVVYLPAAVMIRFIPTFMDDLKMVADALRLKGVDSRFWGTHPLQAVRMAFMPVLFRALKSAENLGLAAQMKGVTGRLTPKPRRALSGESVTARMAAAGFVALSVAAWVLWGDLFVPAVGMPG